MGRAGLHGLADIGEKRRRGRGIGDAFAGHQADTVLGLPHVLKDHRAAKIDRQQHDRGIARHVANRRGDKEDIAGIKSEPARQRLAARDQRVRRVYDALRLARRA